MTPIDNRPRGIARVLPPLSPEASITVVMLLAGAAFLRLFAVVAMRPGGYFSDTSDFGYYATWGQLSFRGFYPYLHYWVEYPPLVPWLSVGLYRLSSLLPRGDSWGSDDLWFRALIGLVFAAADTGTLLLVMRLAWRVWRQENAVIRAGVLYGLAFAPTYVSSAHMDVLPLFFVLLALDLALAERHLASGVAAALGVLTKLFPAIAGIVAIRSRGRWRWLGGLAIGMTPVLAPLLLAGPVWLTASARAMASRQPWESVWAVLGGYYSFGRLSGDPFDPAAAAQPGAGGGRVAFLLALLVLGTLLLWLYRRWWLRGDDRGAVALIGAAMSGVLLVYPGFSPQFAVWLVPFVAVMLPRWRGVAYVGLLTALLLAERVLYFIVLPDSPPMLVALIVLRSLVLLALMLEMASFIVEWRPVRALAMVVPGRRRLLRATGGAMLLGAAGTVAPWVLSEIHDRYRLFNHSTDALGAIEAVGNPTDGVIITDTPLFARVRPYLGQRQTMLVTTDDFTSPGRWGRAQAEVDEFTREHPNVWLLENAGLEYAADMHAALNRQVAEGGYSAYEKWLEDKCWLAYYAVGEAASYRQVGPAGFAGEIGLVASVADEILVAPGTLRMRLTWTATSPPADLSVFVHLVDGAGLPLAQRDVRLPTTAWVQNGEHMQVEQRLALPLPPSVMAGRYALLAGLYDAATGVRLPVVGGGDAVDLREVRVRGG